jgi:prevent-host-death family protein
MRAVQSSEVKARLPEFLDEVERGEVIVITRHGKPVAHLVPAPDVDRERVRKAMEGIREMRKTAKPWSVEEILLARHQGHNR